LIPGCREEPLPNQALEPTPYSARYAPASRRGSPRALGVIESTCLMAILPEYLADVGRDMAAKSAAIRRDFATHRLSAGENREDLVAKFLVDHLPRRFGVGSGLIFSHNGVFSNQADLVVVDDQNNAALHSATRNQLWPVEAVYALVEVKTGLGPAVMADAVAKGRRFKQMERRFCAPVALADSLFVIWAFDSPAPETVKANLLASLAGVPRTEQPDLIVVPERLVAMSGSYLELTRLGQAGSQHRVQLHRQHGANLDFLLPEPAEVSDSGENALLTWYIWFDSWLRRAGPRLTDPISYLPDGMAVGRKM